MEPSQRRISKAPGGEIRSPQGPEHAGEASENGSVGNIDDVSEQAAAERGLRFRAQLLDAVGQAIIATDLQGKVLYWNRCAAELYGWSAREVEGCALHDFLISEESSKNVEQAMSRLRAGKSWSGEFAVRRKDGTPLSVEVIETPVRDDGGDLVGIIVVSTDVTQRKRAEARLRETERRLSTLLSDTPAMVYRCLNEPDWPEEYVSDYSLELTGYPASAFMDNPTLFGSLISEKDRQRIRDEVQGAVGRGERFRLHYAIHHKDGGLRLVEELGQGVYDESGGVVAVEGLIYDVTEREQAEQRLRVAEERYRTLVERIPAVTFVDRAGGSEEPVYVSPQIERMLGYTPQEWMAGRLWRGRLHPEDRGRVLASDGRFGARGGPVEEEYRLLAKDGSVVWVREETVLVRGRGGEPLYLQGMLSDVTGRKEAEEALKRSEERYRTVVERQTELVCRFLPDLTLTFANDAYARYYGRNAEELVGRTFLDHLHESDHAYYEDELARLSPENPTTTVEERFFTPDGMRWLQWTDTAIFDGDGHIVEYQSVGRDITERRALEERLEHQAFHDPLTGLPNRRLFLDRLGQALRRTRRQQNRVAVLFMDLDEFKVVNDSLGHDAGDLLLVVVAQRLRRCLRPEDTLARFGGDEFVVLIEAVADPAEAVQVAERIADELSRPFPIEGRQLFVAASIGIALGEARTKSPEDLLRDADTAMYRAKDEGSGHYSMFDPGMYLRAVRRLELENDLRRAVERNEFVLHYQPIVHLADGGVRGVEALVRWNHPEQGFLNPDEFVPLAEESGLVVPMGEMVLEEACRQAKEWQEEIPRPRSPMMSVNLSARQLRRPDLSEKVERALRKTDFDGRCLTLDVTETAYVEVMEGSVAALDRLREMGVRISIDDFGTGYSSLSYLKRLPADALKIDKSFVRGLGRDPEDTAIVRAIVELAHTFGMETIAEGVETEEQAALLAKMGCDMAQGYLFSEPLAAKEAANLLDAVCHRNSSEVAEG